MSTMIECSLCVRESSMENQRVEKSSHNFEFINVTGGSGRERRRNNYLARAHAAKINRQNHKIQIDSRRSKHNKNFSLHPKALIRGLESKDSSHDHGTISNDDADQSKKLKACRLARSTHKTAIDTVPTPRSISPAYGALSIDTFDWTSQPISAQVGHYLLKVSWPVRSGDEVTRAWWTEFCQSPIVYHVSHIASAVHHDLLVGKSSWSSCPDILLHKTKTIRVINEQLARLPSLSHKAVDQLIFAVCTLSRHELEAKHLHTGDVLLFVPHMPYANGMKPLGRLNLSEPARALLVQLVNSQGGLDKLRIAGLGDVLALIDILESSTDMSKPRFPPFWDRDESMGLEDCIGIGHPSLGRGFSILSDSITAQAAASLQSLAHADMIMAHHELIPSRLEIKAVLYARNTAIHSVLSLPSSMELLVTDQERTDRSMYEACRTAAVIYSNAVLLGLPPHSGWHMNLVGRLRTILEEADLDAWSHCFPNVLIWILFIGGITSYRTRHRQFFETSLRDVLCLSGMFSWRGVRQCLGEFLWSESACEHGAAVIWDALCLDGAWTG